MNVNDCFEGEEPQIDSSRAGEYSGEERLVIAIIKQGIQDEGPEWLKSPSGILLCGLLGADNMVVYEAFKRVGVGL